MSASFLTLTSIPSITSFSTVASHPFLAARWSAVHPSFCRALTSAPSSTSLSTVAVCPFIAAFVSAVLPPAPGASSSTSEVLASTIAPSSASLATVSVWPLRAASWRGAQPYLSTALTSAPSETSFAAASLLPVRAAAWRAVASPSSGYLKFTSAPPVTALSSPSTSPDLAAVHSCFCTMAVSMSPSAPIPEASPRGSNESPVLMLTAVLLPSASTRRLFWARWREDREGAGRPTRWESWVMGQVREIEVAPCPRPRFPATREAGSTMKAVPEP
mmetsp:Transcript_2417/g.6137  ORF Transcript_2417/g.6137 Transcript_2417/m.6137 type:complete len:274 (+) Transcript_2417:374-1195(+)